MINTLDRVPPHDLEAEQALLGSILLAPQVLDDVAGSMEPEHFYDAGHRELYATCRDLYHDRGRIDIVLLTDRLKRDGNFEEIGGAAMLAKIAQKVPHALNASYYAGIVRGKALLRALIVGSQDTLIDAYESGDGMEPEQVLELAERRFTQLSLWRMDRDRAPKSIIIVLHEALDRLERRQRGDLEEGVSSPFRRLDGKTGGWQRGNLIVVGGRPGNGKTALGLQLAHHAAREGTPVLFFSLEMSELELADRLLSQVTRIDGYRLRNSSNLSREENQLIVARAGDLSQLPLDIQADPHRTVSMITSESRRQARSSRGLGMVMIDYLQLINPEVKRGEKPNRQEQVAQMSRQLKHLAKELDVPVVVLAQVNRQSAKDLRPPRLNELRESGAIEQDADMVVFVHRPHNEESEKQPENAQQAEEAALILAKNRMGPTGRVAVTFHRPTASFAPEATDRDEEIADGYSADDQLPTGDRIGQPF